MVREAVAPGGKEEGDNIGILSPYTLVEEDTVVEGHKPLKAQGRRHLQLV